MFRDFVIFFHFPLVKILIIMYNDMDYCKKEGKSVFEGINATTQFKSSITTALRSGTLSHALILEGKSARDRLDAAYEIAAAVLCEGEQKPCGICSKCRKVQNRTHPDVHYLEKDEKSGIIKVDAIRELKKLAQVLPNDGDKSIFIINSAELMNPQAQNALLKIFEEPARHLLFILCCGAKSSLLDTIISRATAYSLGEEIADTEEDEKLKKAKELATELATSFAEENELGFLKRTAALRNDKELFRTVLTQLKLIFRDCIILQHGGRELISGSAEAAKKLSVRLTAKKAMTILGIITELYESSMMNANHNLTLTAFSARLYSVKSH